MADNFTEIIERLNKGGEDLRRSLGQLEKAMQKMRRQSSTDYCGRCGRDIPKGSTCPVCGCPSTESEDAR